MGLILAILYYLQLTITSSENLENHNTLILIRLLIMISILADYQIKEGDGTAQLLLLPYAPTGYSDAVHQGVGSTNQA